MNLPVQRNLVRCLCILFALFTALFARVWATPPAGDPNQAYDRLPGTWETYHVKWARPLAGGALKVLFIVPYSNSREVIELAQRLDVEHTILMTAGRSVWKDGFYSDSAYPSTALHNDAAHGAEADVLDTLAAARLAPGNGYDAIVIGKVSWEVIPPDLRALILDYVTGGTGLVYVSPNRFIAGRGSYQEATGADPQYTALFHTDEDPTVGESIVAALPFDILPLKVLNALAEVDALPALEVYKVGGRIVAQSPVWISSSHHGAGRVLALNYFDNKLSPTAADDSLSPRVEYDKVTYDYVYALLARCVRWSAGQDASVVPQISFQGPGTSLTEPVDQELMPFVYEFKTPQRVFARQDLTQAQVLLSASATGGAPATVTFNYRIRDAFGTTVVEGETEENVVGGQTGVVPVSIPKLPRGNYFVGLRVSNPQDEALDFVSKVFRVEDAHRVVSVTTDRDHYAGQDTITGTVQFSMPLDSEQQAEVRVVDTWGRTVFKQAVTVASGGQSGPFTVPVNDPLSSLLDIYGIIRDADGDVDAGRTWVGIPQQEFDEYYWGLIFAPAPGPTWKGNLYADRIRSFGINGNFSQLLFGYFDQLEAVERANLDNLMFTEHFGQNDNPLAANGPWDVEMSETCPSEISRMLRYTADTGEVMDTTMFPYVANMGAWNLTADWLAHKMTNNYTKAAKFATPFHTLTGENYLSGEMPGVDSPNSCFCDLCAHTFQEWCQEQYANDLNALNAEWGTSFTDWSSIRGILREEAEQNDQRPRWVAFRYFMRSQVWTQLFIDWTDAMRRFIPGARTGRVGHDHFDFSRFRDHMTASKIYNQQLENDELQTMVPQELHQSFSGDQSYLLGASSMFRWMPDHQTPRRNHRLPWKMLFMGFRGFDWENFLPIDTLGGMSCFTPDLSDPMPFFKNISDQVLYLQGGIGKLANTAEPLRSPVAILWSQANDYISRLKRPIGNVHAPSSELYPFSGSWLYNVSFDHGVVHDCLALLKSIRIRGTFVAPEDVINGDLQSRGFTALMLPYSKGMSVAEAAAIRSFVEGGGLVMAENSPGIYSRFGRELPLGRLTDLFPVTNAVNVIAVGAGNAAYLPGQIGGYLQRMSAGDRSGSDLVASLLEQHAGITTPVELMDDQGQPRRDTLMPVYLKGSALYVGMLRHEESDGITTAPTTVQFTEDYHVWDITKTNYLGYTDNIAINLDMYPRFFALFPANPLSLMIEPALSEVEQNTILQLTGTIEFGTGNAAAISSLGQVVHISVFAPGGTEVEYFRQNIVFDGTEFEIVLPISYSETPGTYVVKAKSPVTGLEAQGSFEVVTEPTGPPSAPPSYTILHQSDGVGIDLDSPANGWVDKIADLSGNSNDLWSQDPMGTPNDFTGQVKVDADGQPSPATRNFNGGIASMAALIDLQRPAFLWQADVMFHNDGSQGGLEDIFTDIFSSRSDEWGEGIHLQANPDGSLIATSTFGPGSVTTAAGLVANDVWVNVAVSFEGISDGGLTPVDLDPTHVQAGRQVWDGTLNIYVNGVEKGSISAQHVLNDDSFGPLVGQRQPSLGISANLHFDNITISGQGLLPPPPKGTFIIVD